MKLIHASGFTRSERDDYRGIIFGNLLTSLKVILEAMDGYDIKFENRDNEVWPGRILGINTLSNSYMLW